MSNVEFEKAVVETLASLKEIIKAHDERAIEILRTEVSILTNEATILQLHQETQRDLQMLTGTVREITEALSKQQSLIETNARLTNQLAEIIRWMTQEQTKYRQTQSGMLWKILVAVLGTMNAMLLAILGMG